MLVTTPGRMCALYLYAGVFERMDIGHIIGMWEYEAEIDIMASYLGVVAQW